LKIEDNVKKQVTSGKLPGISVGFIDKNGTKFFNYGEIEKNSKVLPTEDTVFEIASISKTFTSILLAVLQKEGLLNKDDPITKFVPEFSHNPKFEKITLYHLATHTSGFPNLPTKIIAANLFGLLHLSKQTYGSLSNFTKEDLIRYFSKAKLQSIPGKKWSYSNGAVGLLGQIFERITNSSYEELVKNRICNVFDMKDTGIDLFKTHNDRMATGHHYFGSKTPNWIAPAIEGAASLRSTAKDMAKFLSANLGLSKTSLSPELEYCQSTRFLPNLSYFMSHVVFPWIGIKFDEMALGWWVTKLENKEILFHDGGTAGFSSFIGISPKDKTGVVILANKMSRLVHKLGIELLKN